MTTTTTATQQTYQSIQAVYAQEEDDSKTFTDEECDQNNSSSGHDSESSGECTVSIGEEEPWTCVECFREILSQDEIRAVLSVIDFENIEQACSRNPPPISTGDLIEAGIDEGTIASLRECLERIGITLPE